MCARQPGGCITLLLSCVDKHMTTLRLYRSATFFGKSSQKTFGRLLILEVAVVQNRLAVERLEETALQGYFFSLNESSRPRAPILIQHTPQVFAEAFGKKPMPRRENSFSQILRGSECAVRVCGWLEVFFGLVKSPQNNHGAVCPLAMLFKPFYSA